MKLLHLFHIKYIPKKFLTTWCDKYCDIFLICCRGGFIYIEIVAKTHFPLKSYVICLLSVHNYGTHAHNYGTFSSRAKTAHFFEVHFI